MSAGIYYFDKPCKRWRAENHAYDYWDWNALIANHLLDKVEVRYLMMLDRKFFGCD